MRASIQTDPRVWGLGAGEFSPRSNRHPLSAATIVLSFPFRSSKAPGPFPGTALTVDRSVAPLTAVSSIETESISGVPGQCKLLRRFVGSFPLDVFQEFRVDLVDSARIGIVRLGRISDERQHSRAASGVFPQPAVLLDFGYMIVGSTKPGRMCDSSASCTRNLRCGGWLNVLSP